MGQYGITVNAVAPTFIRTDGTAADLADPAFEADVLERIAGLHRIGEPMDVAGGVVFLASPALPPDHRDDPPDRRRMDGPLTDGPNMTAPDRRRPTRSSPRDLGRVAPGPSAGGAACLRMAAGSSSRSWC